MQIQFEVIGKPASQGSVRSVPIRQKGGGFIMKDGRPVLRPIHKSKGLASWRQDVGNAARAKYDGPLLEGPLMLTCSFRRPRPKSHFRTGRYAGQLKSGAVEHPIQRPDTLKLARAVEDALTGVVWRDDSQVVRHVLEKRWGSYYQVKVIITTLES